MRLAVLAVLAWALGSSAAPGQAPAAGDPEAGKAIYNADCRPCHSVSIAPTLRGVGGRPIASVAAFGGYTAGLKAKSAETWTPERLDAFLKAPAAFAPGTMMIKATPDDKARADVIAYLMTLKPPAE